MQIGTHGTGLVENPVKVDRASVAWLVATLTLGVPVASRTALAQHGPGRDPAEQARTLFDQGVQLAAQVR